MAILRVEFLNAKNPAAKSSQLRKKFLDCRSEVEIQNASIFSPPREDFCLWKNCELSVNALPRFRKIFSCRAA